VPRVLVLWCRPYHLSTADEERWVTEQVRPLAKADGVQGAVLTRLDTASMRHLREWNWLLELELAEPACEPLEEWLADLRLLGSRPAVLLTAGNVPLGDT
jgi:hypothetical protein